MNKNVKTFGWIALGTGLLIYPAIRLYKYWRSNKDAAAKPEGEVKHFATSYLGHQHRAHNRKALSNGHHN